MDPTVTEADNRIIVTDYKTICDLRQPLTVVLGRAAFALRRVQDTTPSALTGEARLINIVADLLAIEAEGQRLKGMLIALAGDGVVLLGRTGDR